MNGCLLFQHLLLKRIFFLRWDTFALLSKISWLYLCGFRLNFYYKFGCSLGGISIAFVASRFLYSSSFHQQPKIIVWDTDIVQWITVEIIAAEASTVAFTPLSECTSSFPARLGVLFFFLPPSEKSESQIKYNSLIYHLPTTHLAFRKWDFSVGVAFPIWGLTKSLGAPRTLW